MKFVRPVAVAGLTFGLLCSAGSVSAQKWAPISSFSVAPAGKQLVVDNTSDDGTLSACTAASNDCSLRGAVAYANSTSADTITFLSPLFDTAQTITVSTSISITSNLLIQGPGANLLTLSGGGVSRILDSVSGTSITITDLKMTGGNTGVAYLTGNVLLNRIEITGNSNTGESGAGGAILGGTVRILNSTISNNSGRLIGALYQLGGHLYMANSTVSGNTAEIGYGGIYLENADADIQNSTITDNSGQSAGGIAFLGGAGGQSLFFGNSIIAGNTGAQPEIYFIQNNQGQQVASNGFNLIGDNPGDSAATGNPITFGPLDKRDLDPMLGPLQNNGGPTRTRALLPGSPAIDSGENGQAVDPFDNSPLTSDQRGLSRIVDGDINGTANVEIGAFEIQSPSAAAVWIAGRVTTADGVGISHATVTISGGPLAEPINVLTGPFGYFRFEEIPSGHTYLVSVASKRYTFDPSDRLVNANEDVTGFDFIAAPQ